MSIFNFLFETCQSNVQISETSPSNTISNIPPEEQQTWPPCTQQVTNYLNNLSTRCHEYARLNREKPIVRVNNKLFRGQVRDGLPYGFGQLLLPDDSFLISTFDNTGTPTNKSHLIHPNGTFCQSTLINNKFTDKFSIYSSPTYTYTGSIKDNLFHGQGSLKNKDGNYSFIGEFEENRKKYGKLMWRDSQCTLTKSNQYNVVLRYQYQGGFDLEEEFHGVGVLESVKGVYRGQFLHGVKNGQGEFRYISGVRFVGRYQNGVRNGEGRIYNQHNVLACHANFKDGLPSGIGKQLQYNGVLKQVMWEDGVSYSIPQSPQKST